MALPFRTTRQSLGRRRDQRGAALVEAAIVFIPLCIIVFGIIEYGFVFKDSLTLSSATRAGARGASAESQVASATFFPYVRDATAKAASAANFKTGDRMWIYKALDNGNPADNSFCGGTSSAWGLGSDSCVMYSYTQGSGWSSTYNSAGTWQSETVNACLGGSTPIDSVGVRLSLSHDALTGWFANLQLHERTVMKFEPVSSCG